MDGYMGTLLYVDLSAGKLEKRQYPEDWQRDYIGGRGLGIRILTDMLDPRTPVLDPQNVLIFATGPIVESRLPIGSRYDVVTKSPLTGTCTSANSGGVFGGSLKHAGFDAVVISGVSEKPVYLSLFNGEAEIRDAGDLWGMTVGETATTIQKDDRRARIACIGPAGERLVRISSVMNENSRAAGRGGVGAVMGSKRVKAVAASGDKEVPVADRAKTDALVESISKINTFKSDIRARLAPLWHRSPRKYHQREFHPPGKELPEVAPGTGGPDLRGNDGGDDSKEQDGLPALPHPMRAGGGGRRETNGRAGV